MLVLDSQLALDRYPADRSNPSVPRTADELRALLYEALRLADAVDFADADVVALEPDLAGLVAVYRRLHAVAAE